MSSGVLATTHAGTTWAWVAVRVEAAADLPETREYADITEHDRLVKAVAAETAWLAGQWDTSHGLRIELRYVTEPSLRRLSCAVLARVQGAAAAGAAPAVRARLAGLPRHVHAVEVLDPGEVGRWLAPFRPHPLGLAEIRKRIRAARPQRPDAGVAWYLAVEPFTVAAPDWEPLWQAMVDHPHPVMLTVGLQPHPVPHGFPDALHELATQYGRLAAPGRLPDGLWSTGVPLAADTFAVEAARLYADAARRYTARPYRVRIALASPAPLPEALLGLAAASVSPPERAGGDTVLTGTFQGAPHVVVRPDPAELDAAWRNLSTLHHDRWDGHYLRQLPLRPPGSVRLLAELVDAREAVAAARLPVAVHGHVPGFPVRRPGLALATDYHPSGPAIRLGVQLVADRTGGALGVALPALTRHALVVGTTGSGKTNTMLALCEQLWCDHRVPFLVIEPVNSAMDDYRWLAGRPGLSELVVLTAGDETVAPLRLNPFEAPPGVRIGSHIAGLLACFDAAFGLWDPLPAIYNRALRAAYAGRGIVSTDVSGPRHLGNWPTLADFVARMREQTDRLDYAGEVRSNIIAASRLRAEALAEGSCASTLDVEVSYPVAELMRRPVVVELAAVGDNEKEQSLLIALILQAMTEWYKAGRSGLPAGEGLAHVTVVEEAHRLLGRPVPQGADSREGNARTRAAQAFAHALAENRKYGEAVVIVEQVPVKLVEDAYKNTNLKIMHRLPADDDRQVIGSTMRLSDDQRRHAASLAPFTAFAFHDALDRPALVRVPDVRGDAARAAGLTRAPLPSDADLSRRFRALAAAEPAIDGALAPFAECEGCAHRCAFRARAATAVRPEHAVRLRERVKAYPNTVADQARWWHETRTWVRAIADGVALDEPSRDQRRDYEACVFVHIGRGAWRRDVLPWVRQFRAREIEP